MTIATSKPAEPVLACLALGSNLGDRIANVRSALAALAACPNTALLKSSALHETDPIGAPGQDKYINAAVLLRTSLSPRDLLKECLRIEVEHGRMRSQQTRWGPRTLDIDLLLFGDLIIDDAGPPRLCVPHPRLCDRLFVLDPLAEIAGNLNHPIDGRPIHAIRSLRQRAEYRPRRLCL